MQPTGAWVALLIPAIWLGIVVALSVKSGWTTLAKAFPSPQRVEGHKFSFASGVMSQDGTPVSYGGCLFVTVGDAGIRIAVMPPFRLFSPPLFIPWRSVASVEVPQVRKFFPAATIHLHGRPHTIRFRGDISSLLLKTWARVGHPSD